MSDLIVRLKGDGAYPLDVDATLADLTGDETMMLEEYLGGWDKFAIGSGSTRSVIVTIWLAKRQAGQTVTLDEIAATKGLVFGDVFEVEEVTNGGPPDGAATAAPDILSTPDGSEITGVGV